MRLLPTQGHDRRLLQHRRCVAPSISCSRLHDAIGRSRAQAYNAHEPQGNRETRAQQRSETHRRGPCSRRQCGTCSPHSNPAERVHPSYPFILLNSLCIIVGEGVRLAISLDALHMQASPLLVGTLGSLFSAIPAISSVASGRWVDRAGAGRPMLISALAMAAGAGLGFIWRDLAALFVVSIVVGAFENLFLVATLQVLGRDAAPGARVRNFSILTTANSVGNFISPLAVGFGIDRLGFPMTFLMLALLSLVPAVIILSGAIAGNPRSAKPATPRDDATAATPAAPHDTAATTPSAARSKNALDLLRVPQLRRIYGLAFSTSASVLLYMFLIPLYGVQHGLSASWIGTLLGMFFLSMSLVRFSTPMLTRLFPPWRLMLGSLSASGAMLIVLPFTDSPWVLLPISLFLGASLGLSSPIALSLMAENAPEGRIGEALGLRQTMVNVILTGVPLIAGSLGALLGIAPVFWVISLMLISSCYLARLQWQSPR